MKAAMKAAKAITTTQRSRPHLQPSASSHPRSSPTPPPPPLDQERELDDCVARGDGAWDETAVLDIDEDHLYADVKPPLPPESILPADDAADDDDLKVEFVGPPAKYKAFVIVAPRTNRRRLFVRRNLEQEQS
jgi:hypothetical protein